MDDKPDDIAFSKEQYEKLFREMRDRFARAQDQEAILREAARDDRRFAFGDSENGFQWHPKIWQERRRDDKPCLTINKTKTHVALIVNGARQNPPSAKILPVDGVKDPKSAELMGGLVRDIEARSNSETVYCNAFDTAVTGGLGYWFLDYDYESPESFDYEIKLRPVYDPDFILIDPERDPKKRRWGFVFEEISIEDFKEKWPEIEVTSWSPIDNKMGWHTDKTVRVANYYWREDKKDTICLRPDGSKVWLSDDPKADQGAVSCRDSIKSTWHLWKVAGSHNEPLEASIWPGKWLPIVEIVGDEKVIEGKKYRKGHVRDLKDPARMYNYWTSEATVQVALQNHAPYVGPAEAFAGYEQIWDAANKKAAVYLPYNAFTDDGNAIPAPQKQSPAQMSTALIQGMQQASVEFSMASGQYEAQFGARSNETSGVAIDSRKMQSETTTFHFADRLMDGVVLSTEIMVDLIQKIYTTEKARRILGIDGKESYVHINPSLDVPAQDVEGPDAEIQRIFNPALGQYDIIPSTGPSYQTQRQAGAAAMVDLSRNMPVLGQAAPDLIVGNMDFPMADKIAERLRKTLPPQLIDSEGDGPAKKLAQMGAQMAQMQQQMQQMMAVGQQMHQSLQMAEQTIAEREKEIQQKEQEVQMLKVKAEARESDVHVADLETHAQVTVEQIKAEAAIKVAEINAKIKRHEKFIELNGRPPMDGEDLPELTEKEVDPMEIETLQAIQRAIDQIARPKRSLINITPNPDGTYSGEKIEIPEEQAQEYLESEMHEASESPEFERAEGQE